jgi:hypothetical protein
LSTDEGLAQKVSLFVGLAPAVRPHKIRNEPLKILSDNIDEIRDFVDQF